MAEYIDKNVAIQICMNSWDASDAAQDIKDESLADVIERSEYEKVLEENKQLKHIISDKVDKDLKCAFEVKELRSKIDNALADMQLMLDQEVLNDNVISDVGQGIAIAMELLRTNIGE